MSRSPLWREFESGNSVPLRILRVGVLAGGLLFLISTAVLSLTWPQQAVFAAVLVLLAVWIDRNSDSYLVTLTLMMLSVYATCRYGFWRLSTTVRFFHDAGSLWSGLDAFFIGMLLLAELYAFIVLLLGYLQMLWPLRRPPVPLPNDLEDWPAVDLLIPTLNEPLRVVRLTAFAAINIDWPADKLKIHILDDGHRDEFRQFAEETGIGYITRDTTRNAKAGNINHALDRLTAPFVAIFDSDHVPTRSFLQMTMGWFLRDPKLGILQTPHHFYSPDPFERNLNQFRVVPNEGELFHGVVQDGNDFWNSTLFCGSCAVLRRSALNEVGGMAVETVTEDAHTSLRMQRKGWNSAYINIPQAAGLATERLSAHIRQRIRWARGMVQILRLENPLFARGLKAAQRLCYFNAMSHFLYALPRLIFLIAPLIYLIFGRTVIAGYWAAILAYAVPHLLLSYLTHSRLQGSHRHSFWNEVYETVLAPYLFLPTLLALINPKLGKFDVTPKGGIVDDDFFDAWTACPTLLLLGFNFFGLLCVIPRLVQLPAFDGPGLLLEVLSWPASLYDGSHPGTIAMNSAWTLFNIMILGVATAVAWESRQRRAAVRLRMALDSEVIFKDGTAMRGITSDLSSSGVQAQMNSKFEARVGEQIRFVLPLLDGTATLPATVVSIDGCMLRARFVALTLQEEQALTLVLFSRADRWLGWGESRAMDRPLRSMTRLLKLSWRGLSQTFFGRARTREIEPRRRFAAVGVAVLLLLLLAGVAWRGSVGGSLADPGSRHSIVAVVLRKSSAAHDFLLAFLGSSVSSQVAPSATVLDGTRFSSYRSGEHSYRAADVSVLGRATMIFQEFPWLVVVIALIFCLLLSTLLRAKLRQSARVRLLGNQ